VALALAAAVLAALGYAAGSILQAVGVRGGSGAAALTRSPLYLAGLGVDGLAWLLSLVALRRLPTFAVQSLLAGSLALTVVLARVFLGSKLRPRDTAAVLALVAALGVVGGAGTEQPSPTVPLGAQAALLVAGVLLLLAVLVLRRYGSATFAVLAGLGYSVAALGARAVALPDAWSQVWRIALEPVAWAVVVAGVAGTLGYAAALEKGPVGPATALLWSVEVVVPAVAGFLLLGDVVRSGWWVPTVAALVVVVGCSVVLAGSPAIPEET
jgi:drug/metabolite transporter (DMT)-like permease